MIIASIDIGKRNFAQYIEEFNVDELEELNRQYNLLPTNLQRRAKGVMNDEIINLLQKVCLNGTRLQTGVYDLTANDDDVLDMQTRRNILGHLETYREWWDKCDKIIIEQQYFRGHPQRNGRRGGGTEANVDAIKIGELVLGWFIAMYPNLDINYFSSMYKTQILGAPDNLDKSGRKNWATDKAEAIYRARDDTDMIDLYNLIGGLPSHKN